MSEHSTTVSVKILDKEYQVSCPADEVDALTASARHLDKQMRQIRESGRVFGMDRIAVMAALNITNEFLASRNAAQSSQTHLDNRIADLTRRLGQVLAEQKQLNL
jgi:cell division protein ZapA